jgi:hypothetical protein
MPPYSVERARDNLDNIYTWLDGELADRDWACGGDFALADCAAAPSLFYADWAHPIADQNATLKAYRARLIDRLSVGRCISEARPYRLSHSARLTTTERNRRVQTAGTIPVHLPYSKSVPANARQPSSPGYREPRKARPAASIERRRSGADTDKLFHENAERDAAPSDQMRCATIIISSCVGALPSLTQSTTASTNNGLVDRDMLRHLIAAEASI